MSKEVKKDLQAFSVCSVMHEPLFVVQRFVDHYRALGAEKITVLWDGVPTIGQKKKLEAIAPRDTFEIIYCDDAFWSKLGAEKTIVSLDDILIAGFTFAYDACESPWILFCDADEFLCAPTEVSELLASVPDQELSLRVRNLEAVWGPDDNISEAFGCTHFRAPIKVPRLTRALCWIMLGRFSVFSRGGLMGHYAGKHFLRTGLQDVTIKSHRSWVASESVGIWAHELPKPAPDFFIAHYDGISEDRWIEKWRRRISNNRIADKMSPQRAKQQQLVKEAIEQQTTSDLFKRLYGLTQLQSFILQRLGLITRGHPIQTYETLR